MLLVGFWPVRPLGFYGWLIFVKSWMNLQNVTLKTSNEDTKTLISLSNKNYNFKSLNFKNNKFYMYLNSELFKCFIF